MLKIGLTGGIGSGKSTVANLFAAIQIPVIDADLIARDLTTKNSPPYHKIVDHFGAGVLDTNGNIDRRKLRKIIFSNASARKWLEELLHPLVYQEIEQTIANIDAPYCIIVIPLLLETGQTELVDRILVVDVPEETQIARAATRDKLSENDIEIILANQISRSERLTQADDIIYNDKNQQDLQQQVSALHGKYMNIVANS